MLKNCPFCGASPLERGQRLTREVVAGHAFEATLPVERCPRCGEAAYPPGVLGEFQLRVAVALARAGVIVPEAVRFMRSALGQSAVALAGLLGVRPESVSRWENGKRGIDRVTLAALHQLLVGRLQGDDSFLDLMRALAKPAKLPKVLHDFGAASRPYPRPRPGAPELRAGEEARPYGKKPASPPARKKTGATR